MRFYTKEHEWIEVEGDVATIGITDYAQKQLGDVVFVDVPQAGGKVEAGKEAAVVESEKVASEIYSPLDGTVMEGNTALVDEPSLVNSAPEGKGWFFRVRLDNELATKDLMDRTTYENYISDL